MTELERILVGRLEQIETTHREQTAALTLQLQEQGRSLAEYQEYLNGVLSDFETLCGGLQHDFGELLNAVETSEATTKITLGRLNTCVGSLMDALNTLLNARSK